MKIIFVRHGESEFNARKGEIDYITDAVLTEKGKEQAKYLGKELKKYNISKIYTSNLKRARQTGEIISGIIKVPISESLEELNEYEPKHIRSRLKARLSREHNSKLRKLRKFLRKISAEKNEDKSILIVAHAITNRIIMAKIMGGIPLTSKIFRFNQHNACINILRWEEDYKDWSLKTFNDIRHLPKELSDFEA